MRDKWTQDQEEAVQKGVETADKITEVIGENSKCVSGQGGFSCVDENEGKLFQVFRDGVSVSKMNVKPPSAFDYVEGEVKIKELDDNCKIGTVTDPQGNDISQGMCAVPNDTPLDAGNNLDSMNKKVDRLFE